MCGINGIYNVSSQVLQEPKQLVSKMNAQIAHRGPDDEGYWSNREHNLHFGHQRLSILDLSASGHQPMQFKQGEDCLVYNGEIYNYRELIISEGLTELSSKTDTEVLLHLLKKQGLQALNKLNGMFAFAYWDATEQQLLLARDRAGQKPLYYTKHGGHFAFASELKSLLTLPWVKKELDEKAFYDFLTFNQLSAPSSMFKDIYKLPPACSMVVSTSGEVQLNEYWQPANQTQNFEEEELEKQLLESLQDSVSLRMRSDVPVGAFLSGGVDSSAIVGLMSQFTNQAVSTFSIGFKGQAAYDEQTYAESIAKRFSTQHIVKEIEPQDFKDLLPKMVDIFDEPLADTTCIPIYFLSQLAAEKGNKVILTGDGADELWGGYRNWQKYLKWKPYFDAYGKLPSPLKQLTAKAYGVKKSGNPIHEMLERSALGQDFYWSSASGFKENSKKQFLADAFVERNKTADSYQSVLALKQQYNQWNGNDHQDFLHYLSYTGLKDKIPNLFLYRLDKLNMMHSIEGRAPFLDFRLIDLAFQTPSALKMKNQEPKYILKKSLESLLPKDILYRPKMGFCVPLREWGNEIMLDYLEQEAKSFCKDFDLLEYSKIQHLISKAKKGSQDYTKQLWTFYFLLNWFKRWMI
ncbi:MAG: asparagine synthase (glutamine-hydrolyzing) [Vicingaceae bacterium]